MAKDSMAVKISNKINVIYGIHKFGTQILNGIQATAITWFWVNILKMDYFNFSIIISRLFK